MLDSRVSNSLFVNKVTSLYELSVERRKGKSFQRIIPAEHLGVEQLFDYEFHPKGTYPITKENSPLNGIDRLPHNAESLPPITRLVLTLSEKLSY